MKEQSKAARRRYNDGNFQTKYFCGHGIDVGSGDDSLFHYITHFVNLKWVTDWDIKDGDAQYLSSKIDNHYNFLHSSHCLEHMVDPYIALYNWIRVVKRHGYLIITVPDEILYEHENWPSKFNYDHKHSFSIYRTDSPCPNHINVLDLCIKYSDLVCLEKVELIDHFTPKLITKDTEDLTMLPNCECSIEFILRKL